MDYQQKAVELVERSTIAVMVMLGDDVSDIELLPFRPRPATEEMLEDLKADWPGRGLRTVGWMGLVDGLTGFALKEDLSQEQLCALTAAFIVYVRVFSEYRPERKGDEVEWLRRLWSLEDARPNA